jgi:hypothetical protein
MALDPVFIADCPYGPDAQLIDEVIAVDREASLVVARMPTHENLPLTRDQRAHPVRHPRHVSGALMIHATGIMGFVHGFYVLDMRHADGWIGYGTHIHDAKFRKMGEMGAPLRLECQAKTIRRFKGNVFARYAFRFLQAGELVYESEQSAMWMRTGETARAAG